jgi:branched-chain amino acid transport system permease protein
MGLTMTDHLPSDGIAQRVGWRRIRNVIGPTGASNLLVLAVLAAIPLFVTDAYTLQIFVIALVWLVVVAAWDLITGYAGVFSFAQVAFFVVGAYASGMISARWHISPLLTMPMAGLVSATVAVLIGIPCLRVKGVYVALVTYSLQLVLPTFILRGERFGTGGAGGLFGIPGISVGRFVFNPLDQVPWFYTALGIAAVTVYLIYFRILRSNFGMAVRSLRDAEGFAKSLGVSETRTTLMVFAYSGFFTGLAGAFFAHYTGSVSQDLLSMNYFLLFLVMLTVGGMGRYPGAVLGALFFTFANEYLRISGSARQVIIGTIVIVAILAMPQGVVTAIISAFAKMRRRHQSSVGVADAESPDRGDPPTAVSPESD